LHAPDAFVGFFLSPWPRRLSKRLRLMVAWYSAAARYAFCAKRARIFTPILHVLGQWHSFSPLALGSRSPVWYKLWWAVRQVQLQP